MNFKDYLKSSGQDTFFDLGDIKNKSAFMKDCISKSYSVWTDELNSSSLSRQKTDKTPEEVMKIAEKASYSHYVFILRQPIFKSQGPYIEAGIRTNSRKNNKDYFLWINIKPDKLDYFIKKYKLKEL